MATVEVLSILLFLGCCTNGVSGQGPLSITATLGGKAATVEFTQVPGAQVTFNVSSAFPISALTIFSLPTRLSLGPADRCNMIGMQEPFTITPPNATTGTIGVSSPVDLLYRSVRIEFTDSTFACATITNPLTTLPLGRVDFVRGVVGTLYFVEEAGTVFIRGQLTSTDGDNSIFPLNVFLHSGSIAAYENSPAICSAAISGDDQMIVSNTTSFVSQNSQFSLMSYLYMGVSIRNQAGMVLACARLEGVNPVTASYVMDITFSETLPFAPAFVFGGNSTSLVYPILNEIGTSNNTCIDDSSIFNPWSATAQCTDLGVTFDQCPLGDLRGHAMDIIVPPITVTLLNSPLTGRASIIGHAINNTECTWVKPTAADTNSHIAMATVTFDGPVVTGTIVLRQVVYQMNNELGPAFISVDLSHNRVLTTMHSWHVHQRRRGPEGQCSVTYAGGHYNPFAVNLTSGYDDCNDLNQHRCEMGDLSGKHGPLTLDPSTVTPRRTISYFDETLHLWGPYTVMGRSIVVHDTDGSRLGCANIEPAVLADDEVFFYFPQNDALPDDVDRIELSSEIADRAAVPLGTVLVYSVANMTINGNNCFNATVRVTGSDSAVAESNRIAVNAVDRNNLNQYNQGLCGAGTGLASFSISLLSLLALGVASLYLME